MAKYPIDQLKEFTLGWVEGVRSPGQREIRFDRPLKKIQDAVSGPLSSNAVGQAAASLGVLAAWEGMHGAAAILAGDDTGWARMAISREFLYWDIRVISGMQRAANSPKPRLSLQEIALALAHSVADDEMISANWLGEHLKRGIVDKTVGFDHGTPFEPFMSELFEIRRSASLPPAFKSSGVYGELLANIGRTDERFITAVRDACDYHLARTGDRNDDGYPEFDRPPYLLFPAEVLAVMNVRRTLSLPDVKIEHPLLNTPLAHPVRLSITPDPLLSQFVDRARELLPRL